jgi:parvulin-like peptidyl-prolyl isomerase
MKRFIPLVFIFSILLSNPTTLVWAHTGHKHDTLKVKLPEVVARVNDHDIKRDLITRELKKAVEKYKKSGMPLTADQEKSAAKTLIDDEIGRTLLVLKAKESGIKVSEEMLLARLKEVKSKFKSDAVFEHRLADRGMTVEQYKQELEIDMFMDQIIKKEIEPKIKIAEKDSRDYYKKNKSKFESPEKIRASIMLLKFNPSEGKAGEQAVLNSLAAKGGDLGFFTRKQMLPAFSNRAFKMKVGEISEIFRTGHGFHVLKVTDKKPGGLSPFEAEKAKIEKFLTNKKVSQATRDYIETLKKQAKIKTYF